MTGASILLTYPRIAMGLARFLGTSLTLEQSQELLKRRMDAREARFLGVLARYVYGHPQSPYLPLLRAAGCEYGDLQAMVRQRGVEGTLERLRDEGVYLSFEEFKGRVDVVRGGYTLRFADRDFDNPAGLPSLMIRTGATRSVGSPVNVSLENIAEAIVPHFHILLGPVRPRDPLILWLAGFPSGAGIAYWLALAKMRRPARHWFTMTDPRGPLLTPRHRALPAIARFLSRRWGMKLPAPTYVPVPAPGRVLDALLAARRQGEECTLFTSPSAAVRIAALAQAVGETLRGVRIFTVMEPLTPGKAEDIQRAGAVPGSIYGFSEGGVLGVACGQPSTPDDMHLMADCFALILNRRQVSGIGELQSFMLTALHDFPRKVLLNVEIDDFGDRIVRRCGCAFDALGFHTHLAAVRSFTKLTGEGTMIPGVDCVRILEEVLPQEFGGRSIDYQLLEAEDAHHLTRLFLVVSPTVGQVDERKVLARFTEELHRVQPRGIRLWLQDDTIRIVRREPVTTAQGKLLPVHTQALAPFGASAPRER